MHIERSGVKKLEDLYRKTYNKELNGKNMEQFHGDFSMKGSAGPIVSVQSMFLGKKSYIDILKSVDKKGKTIYSHHIRLKGITEAGINHAILDCKGPINLFSKLAQTNDKKKYKMVMNPEPIKDKKIVSCILPDGDKYDLTIEPEETDKVLFEFNNAGVKTRGKFIRELKF